MCILNWLDAKNDKAAENDKNTQVAAAKKATEEVENGTYGKTMKQYTVNGKAATVPVKTTNNLSTTNQLTTGLNLGGL